MIKISKRVYTSNNKGGKKEEEEPFAISDSIQIRGVSFFLKVSVCHSSSENGNPITKRYALASVEVPRAPLAICKDNGAKAESFHQWYDRK